MRQNCLRIWFLWGSIFLNRNSKILCYPFFDMHYFQPCPKNKKSSQSMLFQTYGFQNGMSWPGSTNDHGEDFLQVKGLDTDLVRGGWVFVIPTYKLPQTIQKTRNFCSVWSINSKCYLTFYITLTDTNESPLYQIGKNYFAVKFYRLLAHAISVRINRNRPRGISPVKKRTNLLLLDRQQTVWTRCQLK